MIRDLRYGIRMLGKNPSFTLVAVLTLALGIGANSTIFSIVNAVLLRPLPYPQPERIVSISYYRKTEDFGRASGAEYLDWRDQSKMFEQIAAYISDTADFTGNGEPERLAAAYVSSGLFATLGVEPLIGRVFTPAEDQPGGDPVVILSHSLWRRRFGGDPHMIGRALVLGGQSRMVIGIMPPGFQFPGKIDLWVPLVLNVNRELERKRGVAVDVIARLKSGKTLEDVRADLSLILHRQRQAFPDRYSEVMVKVIRLSERLVRDVQQALLVLFGAVTFVLLIACTNVANLLLTRAVARQKEMVIRAAVGAGRLRLVRQLLTESLLLSLMGAAIGLLLAMWGVKLFVAMCPAGIPRIKESSVDCRVLGFACAVALLTGLLASLFPALRVSKTDVNETLKTQSAVQLGRRGVWRSLPALMIAEIALVLVLLIGAGLMIKSFLRLLAVPKGFNPDSVLTLELSPSWIKYPPGSPQRRAYFQELLARIQTLPGIQSASLATSFPLSGGALAMGFQIEGRSPVENGKEPSAEINLISLDYFQSMGLLMRGGRTFTAQDSTNAPPVAIINETMSRSFFSNENPIGHRLLLSPDPTNPRTIVGVVGDIHHFSMDREVIPEIYMPYLQNPNFAMRLVVRAVSGLRSSASSASFANLAAAMRNQVLAQEPNEPVNQIVTMNQHLSDSIAPRRFQMLLLSTFAAVALIIAIVGIYGVTSYAVSQRKHEIGIRLALGAAPRDVMWMMIRLVMILTSVGVALGLVAALALTRVVKSLLFSVSATDPAIFALIALLLVSAALMASYIPARRATKVDPLIMLRSE